MLTFCPNFITTHYNFCVSVQSVRIGSVHQGRRNIFGKVRMSSGNHRKSSEVTVTFSEIPEMTRRKSHAFDSEKVGRYTLCTSH